MREGEAPVAPRRREQEEAAGPHRHPPGRLRPTALHHEPEERVRVLVEAAAELQERPRIVVDGDVGQEKKKGRAGDARREQRGAVAPPRGEPEPEWPDEELRRRRESDQDARLEPLIA